MYTQGYQGSRFGLSSRKSKTRKPQDRDVGVERACSSRDKIWTPLKTDMVDMRVSFAGNPLQGGALDDSVSWCFGHDCSGDYVTACGALNPPHGVDADAAFQGCSPLTFDSSTNTVRVVLPASTFSGDLSHYRIIASFSGSGGRNDEAPCFGYAQSIRVDTLPPFSGAAVCSSDAGTSVP